MPVRIVTDSACDLPEPICEELGIEVVPLTIRFGDREYVDRKELSVDAFWRELETSSVLPETAAPSVGAFEETFRRLQRRRRRRHRLHQPVGAAVGHDAVRAGRGESARRRDPDRDHRLAERVDGHRQPRRCTPRAGARDGASIEEIVREVEARKRRAATCSRRSTPSSTSARAAASAARRRCSDRCSRSSRSSP